MKVRTNMNLLKAGLTFSKQDYRCRISGSDNRNLDRSYVLGKQISHNKLPAASVEMKLLDMENKPSVFLENENIIGKKEGKLQKYMVSRRNAVSEKSINQRVGLKNYLKAYVRTKRLMNYGCISKCINE